MNSYFGNSAESVGGTKNLVIFLLEIRHKLSKHEIIEKWRTIECLLMVLALIRDVHRRTNIHFFVTNVGYSSRINKILTTHKKQM